MVQEQRECSDLKAKAAHSSLLAGRPYLSVTILTLSPADTLAPGDMALSTLNRSSLRSTPTICAASDPMVWPAWTVTTRMCSGFSAAFSAGLSTRKEPLTERATESSDALAEGAAVSS